MTRKQGKTIELYYEFPCKHNAEERVRKGMGGWSEHPEKNILPL